MPHPLSVDDFETLQELSDAGDRIGYYGQLEEWGYKYGELARGVVTGDQLSGRTANNFFQNRAVEQIESYNEDNGFEPGDVGYASSDITKTDMAELSQALMEADLAMRQDERSHNDEGIPLHVDLIEEYHKEIFREQFADRVPDVGIRVNAWTPYEALQKQDSAEERDEMWRDMLEDPAMLTAVRTGAHPFSDYGRDQEGAGIVGMGGTEGNVGPYTIDVPGSPDGGRVIAGTGTNVAGFGGDDGTEQRPVLGTNGSDTLYMFTGNDVVDAQGGDDRAYLGSGDDIATLGAGDDRAFPGSGWDKTDGGPGIDFVDYSRGYDLPQTSKSSFITLSPRILLDKNNEFDVLVDNDTIRVREPGLTEVTWGREYTDRTIDTATDVEGYTGSPIRDVVTLRGTDETLYLSGGAGNEDSFIAALPPDVASSAIFDVRNGIIPEGQDFGGYNYDGRIQIDPDTIVYVVDFEKTDMGEIREGRIADVAPDMIQTPGMHTPDVIDEPALEGSMTTEEAILRLGAEQRAIEAGAECSVDVQAALSHPDAYRMFENLCEHDVSTIPATVTPDMPTEDVVVEILSAGQAATKTAGLSMPDQTRDNSADLAAEVETATHLQDVYAQDEDMSYAL